MSTLSALAFTTFRHTHHIVFRTASYHNSFGAQNLMEAGTGARGRFDSGHSLRYADSAAGPSFYNRPPLLR